MNHKGHMTTSLQSLDDRLLLALQKGLPVESRPFAAIGRDLALSESDVLCRIKALFESGVARRFGAVFDSRSLGYESTLCAVDIPAAELVSAAERITPHPGITHCYERDGHPNLWFTMTARSGTVEKELARIEKSLGPYPLLNLPALEKFKIEAVFGQDDRDVEPSSGVQAADGEARMAPHAPTIREQAVVRCLQRSIPVVSDPFNEVARLTGYATEELLQLLQHWRLNGTIRRIALVVRHHKIGFSANSMCVWKVERGALVQAGKSMARNRLVTHCYERPSTVAFPYNLYAMIHAKSRDEAVSVFESLSRDAGCTGGRMMWSVREFKKSSPVFFCEPTPDLGVAPT